MILTFGAMVTTAMEAREILLEEDGLNIRVVNARFAKPIDEEALIKEMAKQSNVFTLEEHWLSGGFGSACFEALEMKNDSNIDIRKLHRIGIDDRFIPAASRQNQLISAGLDAESLVQRVRDTLKLPTRVKI